MLRNGRTGSTHLVEPPASEVLRALLQATGWSSAEEIAAAADEAPALVAQTLQELERLGLAEAQAR